MAGRWQKAGRRKRRTPWPRCGLSPTLRRCRRRPRTQGPRALFRESPACPLPGDTESGSARSGTGWHLTMLWDNRRAVRHGTALPGRRQPVASGRGGPAAARRGLSVNCPGGRATPLVRQGSPARIVEVSCGHRVDWDQSSGYRGSYALPRPRPRRTRRLPSPGTTKRALCLAPRRTQGTVRPLVSSVFTARFKSRASSKRRCRPFFTMTPEPRRARTSAVYRHLRNQGSTSRSPGTLPPYHVPMPQELDVDAMLSRFRERAEPYASGGCPHSRAPSVSVSWTRPGPTTWTTP